MEITKIRDFVVKKSSDTVRSLEFNPVIKCLLSFIGSFLLTNPFVSGEFSPFSISLVAASPSQESFFAGAGAIIGTFFFFDGADCLKYCAASLFCVLLKNLYEKYLEIRLHKYALLLNSFSGLFLVTITISLATGFNFDVLFTGIYEASLCCIGAYLFVSCAHILWGKKDASSLTTYEFLTILLTFGIILMPFYKYKLIFFSPVMVVFSFLILLSARIRNSNGGALSGICLGFVSCLSSEIGFISIGCALGGLFAGELSRKGKLPCIAGYILPIILSAFAEGSLNSYTAIFEGITACIIFLCIPERFYDSVSLKVNAPPPVSTKCSESLLLTEKLCETATVMDEVSSCVKRVQDTLNPLMQTQLDTALKSAWRKVCSECELKESCRNEIKNPDDDAIEKIAQTLSNNAELDETRFPKGFFASCYCFSEMKSALYDRYLSFVASIGAQCKVEQTQSLMCEQFSNIADILRHFALDLNEEMSVNTDIAEICVNEAKESGLTVHRAECFIDKFGRASISLDIAQPHSDFNITQFTRNLSTVTGTSLNLPELEEDGENCTLLFKQSISFNISIGAKSRAADNEPICGDYYRSFRDDNGRYIIILSDGMGTGNRAAIDSAMTAELFSKLIKAGISFDCALAVTNSALLIKSTDESLSTLDAVCIDLYTGKTDFMKAGAAATFIRHKNSVAELEDTSLPIGILKDISFSGSTASLSKGDIILMVSDGILGDCNNWIQHELKAWNAENPPDELAEFIVNSACERKIGKHLDDMTAIAVYIE